LDTGKSSWKSEDVATELYRSIMPPLEWRRSNREAIIRVVANPISIGCTEVYLINCSMLHMRSAQPQYIVMRSRGHSMTTCGKDKLLRLPA
jgi:hypothetical protein